MANLMDMDIYCVKNMKMKRTRSLASLAVSSVLRVLALRKDWSKDNHPRVLACETGQNANLTINIAEPGRRCQIHAIFWGA